jgi:hypothetical protein
MRQAMVFKWWKYFGDGETNVKGKNHLVHYPPEACSKWSAACLPREVLQKRDCYSISTKFQFVVIR